jgi:hypothetical protein
MDDFKFNVGDVVSNGFYRYKILSRLYDIDIRIKHYFVRDFDENICILKSSSFIEANFDKVE